MLPFLPFALLDVSEQSLRTEASSRRRSPQPPPFVLMGILRAVVLERDLRYLGLQAQPHPESPDPTTPPPPHAGVPRGIFWSSCMVKMQ